jgi:hypothetical protein
MHARTVITQLEPVNHDALIARLVMGRVTVETATLMKPAAMVNASIQQQNQFGKLFI